MRKTCIGCECYEPIYDGYGMCTMDELPVTVMANYKPTKNFLQCDKTRGEENENSLSNV